MKALPIYEYVCNSCSARFEIKQGFTDDAKTFCHLCGGKARRVFSPVPIIFKCPGFYVTDNRATENKRLNNRRDGGGVVTDAADDTKLSDEDKRGVAS